MVKVLANGELVADNDPRVQLNTSSGSRQEGFGGNVHSNVHSAPRAPANQPAQGVSIFETLNQRLVASGIPSWNIGPYVVDPIVSVGFLLSLLILGLQGLLFSGLLFFIVKYSGIGGQGTGTGSNNGTRMEPGRRTQEPNRRPGGGGAFSGAGNRLGRS